MRETMDSWVAGLSEMSDTDLNDLLDMLERTYIHGLIEQGLRGASR